MPDVTCPRCKSSLRPEDWTTWRIPFDPAFDRSAKNVLRVSCWCCTWDAEWEIDEVSEPQEVKLG